MGCFHVILLVLQLAVIAAAEADQVLDGCPDRCGDVAIPFPFGIGDKCNLDDSFNITCDHSTTPPKAFLRTGNINVTDISISEGELQVLQYVADDCYNEDGTRDRHNSFGSSINLFNFTVSSKKNKFTIIGCDTYAFLEGFVDEKKYTTGCMSICDRNEYVNYESCTGVGCCQISSLTPGLKNFTISIKSYYNHTKVWDFNPCSYAVIAEESKFNFSKTSFRDFKRKKRFPLILDWAIGDFPCEEARKKGTLVCNLTSSECFNPSLSSGSGSGSGYLCRCLQGFHGNPYHPKGCQDIDECKDPNQCTNGICINLPGSFNCSCLKGYEPVNKTTCAKPNPRNGQPTALFFYISLGVCLGLLTLIATSLMMYWGMSKRKLTKLKEKFFEKNGGLMLQQRLLMSTEKGPGDQTATKIFTQEELERATNNYHASRIIGEGGCGIVYKGILENNKFVAIKKSKLGAHQVMQTERTEQFINEVILLMQINHRNVVRLLGCCLETEVPTLVYEFISNGTLFQHLHNKGIEEPSSSSSLSWELRLKIATETAGALAYLHYETTTPIFHRDVKTMNILLDENYTAKVSDFGASRLIPQGDQEQISTLVQGTVGYLDPEYLQSNQLTGKSDVYSFGVVLGELLTGKKAFWFDKSNGVSHILSVFLLSSNEDDQLHDLIDDEIILNHVNMDIVKGVAKLAKRCLKLKGEERPTMKEVAMELEGLRAAMSKQHPWGEVDSSIEEKEYLLSEHPTLIDEPYSTTFDLECGSTSATTTATYYSIQNQMIPNDDGR